MYHAYCKYYELDITKDFISYWRQLPTVVNCESNVDRPRDMIDNNVLKILLKKRQQKFRELYMVATTFYNELRSLRNAFVQIYNVHASVYHMVCIKNGYVIDSSYGDDVYAWCGEIKGYRRYEFVSFIELLQ
jgi:hypothetical protein